MFLLTESWSIHATPISFRSVTKGRLSIFSQTRTSGKDNRSTWSWFEHCRWSCHSSSFSLVDFLSSLSSCDEKRSRMSGRTITSGEKLSDLWRDRPTTITATAVQPLGNKSPPLADRSMMRPIKSIRHIAGEKYRRREFRHYDCMFFNPSVVWLLSMTRLNRRSPTRKGFRSIRLLVITHLVTRYTLQQYSEYRENPKNPDSR